MPSPADDVSAFLAANAPGLTVGANLFCGEVRAADDVVPMSAVFVSDEEEGGGSAAPYLGVDADDCRLVVTVTVRGEPAAKKATRDRAIALRDVLQRADIPGYYSCLAQDARPEYVERDDADCPMYEFAVEVRWEE